MAILSSRATSVDAALAVDEVRGAAVEATSETAGLVLVRNWPFTSTLCAAEIMAKSRELFRAMLIFGVVSMYTEIDTVKDRVE